LAELGEVTYIPLQQPEASPGAQYVFLNILHNSEIIPRDEWICWLDLDEFLNIHLGLGHIGDLRAALGHADGIRINWRLFGAEAEPPWPGRQLHPDLCRCAPPDLVLGDMFIDQRTIKSFYRYVAPLKANNHGPNLNIWNELTRPVWLNGNGEQLLRRPLLNKWIWRGGFSPIRVNAKPAYDWAQINHYFIRHPALTELRRLRGRGSNFVMPQKPGTEDFSERHTDSYFARYNRTDSEDTSILRHLPAVDAEMTRLLADPVVKHWHDHAQARVAAFLAAQADA
jgi:hypothetical protein